MSCIFTMCSIALIAPVHKVLGHEDGIQSAGKADDLSLEFVLMTVTANENVEIDHSDKSVADFRERMALCKTEVIHCNIAPWQDNRHNAFIRSIMPIFQRHIHKVVGNTLEKQF